LQLYFSNIHLYFVVIFNTANVNVSKATKLSSFLKEGNLVAFDTPSFLFLISVNVPLPCVLIYYLIC
ncbi:hypothetical protein, partial [Bacteroides thetaiotaomicron]|uniref:hypothetical protein n=1 Tax=Bacteroides thetaiotaomicron TaxID=818 RepID=UPI0032605DA1